VIEAGAAATPEERGARAEPARQPPGNLGGHAHAFFLHLPKTGGVAFQEFLRHRAGLGRLWHIPPGDDMIPALTTANEHRVIHGHVPYPVTGVLAKPPFVMTFIRSPSERMISAYEFVQRNPDLPEHRNRRERGIETIADLARDGRASNVQTMLLGMECEVRPLLERFQRGELTARQARTLLRESKDRTDTALERAKSRLERMHFFGITEAFDDSLRLFARRIKSPAPWRQSVRNAASPADREARRSRYTREDLDAIAAANRLDQELYDFAVMLFVQRYREAFYGESPAIGDGG
jgi:hypothetical protein